jgi:ABC-type phosphate transport system substrate-binding protein
MLLFSFIFGVLGLFADVAVIANKDVPVDEISSIKLLDLYTKDIREWKNGDPVTVFDLKPKSKVKIDFYKFLGKSPSRIKSIWMKKMLSGEGDPPEALQSEAEMLEKVSTTKGAIGFIHTDLLTDEVKMLIKIENEN